MKIVLITGMSGAGKTAICKNLCERYDKFNFVFSYTDRDMREENEWGHTFINSKYMDLLLKGSDIVAQTVIDGNRYCTTKNQFDEDKINLYTVDVNGINDTLKSFPRADIMIVLIKRLCIQENYDRINRKISIPSREDVDFVINNDSDIELSANLLNTFVNFNFFKKKSRGVLEINKKIEYIDKQYELLNHIRQSLYKELKQNNNKDFNF